jgi:hypothetical protein
MQNRFITIENKAGETQNFRGYKITPFSKVISIKLPGFTGFAAWIRPSSVLVESSDGEEKVLPVPDVTRIAQWSLMGFAVGLPFLVLLVNRGSRGS